MRGAALAPAVLAATLPLAVAANSITLTLVPTADPDRAVYCSVSLMDGRLRVFDGTGPGVARPVPMVWHPRPDEVLALMAALQVFVAGELPLFTMSRSDMPDPPYATALWMTMLDGQIVTGRYVQQGTELPGALAAMVATILPGSNCAGALPP